MGEPMTMASGASRVYPELMEQCGFTLLKNEYITLEDYSVTIIGCDDVMLGSRTMQQLPEDGNFHLVLVMSQQSRSFGWQCRRYHADRTHPWRTNLSAFFDRTGPSSRFRWVYSRAVRTGRNPAALQRIVCQQGNRHDPSSPAAF